jgi:hypothetical protein
MPEPSTARALRRGQDSTTDVPREPHKAGSLHEHPADEQRPASNAVCEYTRQRGKEQRSPGPGQEPQTSLERRVADRQLEVLRHQEDAAEDRPRLEESGRIRG